MNKARETRNEINEITAKLIELGICDSQNYAVLKFVSATRTEVSFEMSQDYSIILKNISYNDLYKAIKSAGDYNIAMADGALLQLQYTFEDDEVVRHRLAFLPSPDLAEYQNAPDLYDEEVIFAEVIEKGAVTIPLRFDFDKSAYIANVHPMSHCTLGQYKNCRIPVSSALSPYRFFEFILNSFYNTAYNNFCSGLTGKGILHPTTITPNEMQAVHIACKTS